MLVWKWIRLGIILGLLAVWSTGCMYPQERKLENQLPVHDQVALVQEAIDRFFAEKSILPIVTKAADTPVYEKYVIDFGQLVPKYVPYIPGAAFEQGGSYLFVLTNVETKPTVRLLDLKLVHQIGEIQSRVSYYWDKNKSLPVAGVIKPGYFTIDLKKIGVKQEKATVQSPLTGNELPVIMSSQGVVGIDYGKDLEMIIKNNSPKMEQGMDILSLIPENSLYVPVKSFPYALENGLPSLLDPSGKNNPAS